MTREFSPRDELRALNDAGVRYVVIGGLAALLLGSPLNTLDADICPDDAPDNLDALARALAALNAHLRVARDAPVPMPFDAGLLASARIWNLVTDFGDLDITFQPAGTDGYRDLIRHAIMYDLGDGVTSSVASLDDVIRSKEAANRPKDHLTLPTLRKLRELRRERPDLA